MPIIDGEKYACQSCIKGHRVSGCQHIDRELTHINPKGRPVKQCEHCRGARKAKSHHARCDCGSKKDKEGNKDKLKADSQVEDAGCGCYNGSKCTCGVKKEPVTLKLDTNFPRTIPPQQQQARPKHRLTTANSESQLTVFANGHHKPCHRLNNTAHTSGAPYKIPRPHTLHGTGHHHSHGSLNHFPTLHGQRSVDDLTATEPASFPQFSASVDSLPLNALPEGDGAGFFFSQPPSNSGAASDHSSPVDVQSADAFGFGQWPWNNQVSQPVSQYGLDAFSTSPTAADYLSNLDNDFAIPSAGLNPLWSAGDLPLDPGKLTNTMTPPMSVGGDSNSNRPSVPGLTSGSSGAQSEAGDPVCLADNDVLNSQSGVADPFHMDDVYRRADWSHYRMGSVGKWPDYRQAPTSVPTSESPQAVDMDNLNRTQSAVFSEASPSVEPERSFSTMGMDAKSIMYTPGQGEFKPATYPNLGNAPRSLTMPSSPADTYTDLTSWPSQLSLSGATGFGLPGDFDNTVDVSGTYQFTS